jgi:NAD(P)-dependent dehydrogenase (short-subunit alcohol dehydrogenase family)
MAELKDKVALIVGAGSGLSASIARALAKAGMQIALKLEVVGPPATRTVD